MLTPEQVLASHKANLETLFGLTTKAFEGVEKLVELNMTASKAALSELADSSKAMMSAKDAQELMSLVAQQASQLQPLAEKTASYSRHLFEITSSAGADLGKTLESQAADMQKKFMAVLDNATKNAPAGTEAAVAVIKGAVAAGNNTLESVQKAVKQAADIAESNFHAVNAVAANAVNAAKAPARAKR